MNYADSLSNVQNFLQQTITQLPNSSRPTFLMTHQRIWDEKQRPAPFMAYKSYDFNELLSLIKGKVDYIFAGDSPSVKESNVAYSVFDKEGIICYSCGSRSLIETNQHRNKIYFTMVVLTNNKKIKSYPKYVFID